MSVEQELHRAVDDMLPMLEALAEHLDIDPTEVCEAEGVCAAWACREAGCIADKIRRAENALTRAAIEKAA